ncbi:MAG: NAD(P)-dependent oxidoreductase, partial [Oscillospiraceae bacterium]|nr:NAD(P)-dependent oxidoreductase [Oscillospiraceae bacterium]
AWLYGLNGKNFVKTITSLARDRGYLNVVNDQTGNPTNAADLAHHLLKLALTEENGIFHCTNNGICSWYDFTVEIMKLTGIAAEVVPCTTEEFPRPAARPAYSALDNLRLRQTVGDEMRSWQDAIHDYIDELNKG